MGYESLGLFAASSFIQVLRLESSPFAYLSAGCYCEGVALLYLKFSFL
jgi:hypothetical protein